MLKINKTSAGVYIVNEGIISLDNEAVDFLKARADEAPLRRARICAHRNNDDPIHEMLIVQAYDSYIRPHKHLNKSESFHVVEGCADIIIFKENGDILKVIPLGNKGNFFFRLSDSLFHTIIINSPYFVIHETTNGPFNHLATQYAPFSPAMDDFEAINIYVEGIRSLIIKNHKSL